jgi:anti-sigma regulatory factor (Ser/Thr protein kinase)
VDARQSFDASPERLAELRTLVAGFAEGLAISPAVTDVLVLAVSEAAANAIMHSGSPTFEVHLHGEDSILVVEIQDRGLFRRGGSHDGGGHYGVRLMRTVFDQVEIQPGTPRRPGTKVRLLKRL